MLRLAVSIHIEIALLPVPTSLSENSRGVFPCNFALKLKTSSRFYALLFPPDVLVWNEISWRNQDLDHFSLSKLKCFPLNVGVIIPK
jgi:hypothetical protein